MLANLLEIVFGLPFVLFIAYIIYAIAKGSEETKHFRRH